jgi:hypothetical protein
LALLLTDFLTEASLPQISTSGEKENLSIAAAQT